ncbi:unnamed protein product [Ilex paraguariensis]|uniref:Uncharacterized protein n=1 Tax=Ilex paraguariensis TaxID=185542 RepID=A0ABC8UYG5_9AQUA
METQPVQPSTFNSGKESQPFFHTKEFTVDEQSYPQKQELFQGKFPASSCKTSSSPTALGLLLRSSIFRELVEKNSSVSEEENLAEDAKDQRQKGSDDDHAGIFYEGTGDAPFVLSSNGHDVELQGDFHFSYNRHSNPLGTTL